jgi:hypothetical protein
MLHIFYFLKVHILHVYSNDLLSMGLRQRHGLLLLRRRVKQYGQGLGRCCLRVYYAVCSSGGELSGATSVRRGQGGEKRKSRRSRGETDTSLDEQSILEGSDHVQMYVSSVGFQARRWATGRSPPPVSVVRRPDHWTERRGAPPCDLGSCRNYCCFARSQRNGGWIGAKQGA